MKTRDTGIEGLIIIEPRIFVDPRGYFFESYNQNNYNKIGANQNFIQDNQSKSEYGVIRGLHFQKEPHAQSKLVRVLSGAIYDVAVDLRKDSLTYGEWFGLEISAENNLQLIVPKGFAHGFSVLSDEAVVLYKCDAFYHPESDSGIRYNDPELAIDWLIPAESVKVSDKDTKLPFLSDMQ